MINIFGFQIVKKVEQSNFQKIFFKFISPKKVKPAIIKDPSKPAILTKKPMTIDHPKIYF